VRPDEHYAAFRATLDDIPGDVKDMKTAAATEAVPLSVEEPPGCEGIDES
jgi:hypothetical protein